jgi:hypothetical protein
MSASWPTHADILAKVLNQAPYREKGRDKKVLVPTVTVFYRFYMVKENHAETPIRPRRNTDTAATKRNTAATKCK